MRKWNGDHWSRNDRAYARVCDSTRFLHQPGMTWTDLESILEVCTQDPITQGLARMISFDSLIGRS